ncbi:MAG: phosphatase PAP2 family protein [Candidatus Marinimicrobia bacterium]|nr:phosphatase PAP2 family protein [Candidatus Neomarinimicrobiota bacterium]
MPSNHAANISAIAVVLSYFYDKMKIPLYSLAVIIAFSRVYVGVHYPADVLLGGFIGYGMAWSILTLWVILKMRELKRGQTWVWYEGDLQNK